MRWERVATTSLGALLCGAVAVGCGASGGGGGGGTASAISSGTTSSTSSNQAPTQSTPPPSTSTPPPPSTNPTPAGSTVPTTTDNIYYEPQVRQVLHTYCTSCHANASDPAFNAYPLAGFPSDTQSYNDTVARINTADPEASTLMRKALGEDAHGGGKILNRTDTGYAWLVNWVRQGARYDVGTSGPTTYARDVQPFVDRQCFGCHAGGAGGFTLSGDLMANYNELLSLTDPNNPTQSRILLKTDGTLSHNGGSPWGANSTERATILKWISDGRRYAN